MSVAADAVPLDADAAERAYQAAFRARDAARNPTEFRILDAELYRAQAVLVAARAARASASAVDRREERQAEEARRAARPQRWRALPLLARVLYVVAAEPARPVRSTLIRIAEALSHGERGGAGTSVPPDSFEAQV